MRIVLAQRVLGSNLYRLCRVPGSRSVPPTVIPWRILEVAVLDELGIEAAVGGIANVLEEDAYQLVADGLLVGGVDGEGKGVASNVDFYSGLLYSMLDIPCELYTPLFATARIAGWSAHRLEELVNTGKIIRPAYMSISDEKEYRNLNER